MGWKCTNNSENSCCFRTDGSNPNCDIFALEPGHATRINSIQRPGELGIPSRPPVSKQGSLLTLAGSFLGKAVWRAVKKFCLPNCPHHRGVFAGRLRMRMQRAPSVRSGMMTLGTSEHRHDPCRVRRNARGAKYCLVYGSRNKDQRSLHRNAIVEPPRHHLGKQASQCVTHFVHIILSTY